MKIKLFMPFLILANIICSPCFGQKQIDVTYIANEGFLIESSDKQIVIDGLFSEGWGNYLVPSRSIVSDIVNLQGSFGNSHLMLITHDHGDHFNPLMVVPYLIKNSDNILIAPPKVTNAISKHTDYEKYKNQIVQLDKSNQKQNDTTIAGVRVRSFFIQHDSRPQIENVGYLIYFDGLKIFHCGDSNGSDSVEYEKLQLQDEDIDLAFLNIYGFWNTKEGRDFTETYIKPKEIALMHIPPAEIENVKDSVSVIDDFINITVFESSMNRKTYNFE